MINDLIKWYSLKIQSTGCLMYKDVYDALISIGHKNPTDIDNLSFCIALHKKGIPTSLLSASKRRKKNRKDRKAAKKTKAIRKYDASWKADKTSSDFLKSYEWKALRLQALILHGRRCQCCGASPDATNNVVLNVDHIKPRKLFPNLALNLDNLQVLCGDCNHGKGNWNQTDFRPDKSML